MQGELFCFAEVVFGGVFCFLKWRCGEGEARRVDEGSGRGPPDLRFLFGNPMCGLGTTFRAGGSFSLALLLSPGKEVSKKPAPDARHSTRQQSRQICLWHNICVVVVTRQSQRLPSLLRLASVAPERFCGASQLLRNLRFLVSPARFLRGGHGSRGLRAP